MTEAINEPFTIYYAVGIATEVHKDQRDKAGRPYINHPMAVMQGLRGTEAQMTAALHDVVEDHPDEYNFESLTQMGCPPTVIEALKLVTHPPTYSGSEEEYMTMIQAIADSGNQIAIDVKFKDLTHNSDLSRLPNPTEKDLNRVEKYKRSIEILRPKISPYLTEKITE